MTKTPHKDVRFYKTREGAFVTPPVAHDLLNDESYWLLRQFKNDKVHVRLIWTGRPSDERCMEDYWDIYEIAVMVFSDEFNAWVRDKAADKRYWSEKTAIEDYESFLVAYTDCLFNEGNFVEVGNQLVPPDPAQPTGQAENDFIGSW